MIKRNEERKFISEWQKWARHQKWKRSFAWEAKVCYDNKPLNFKSDIKEHQLTALKLAKHKILCYKISDLDQLQKPMDGFLLTNCDAFFIIHWVEKGNKEFYMVDIDTIINEINKGQKSLTKNRAEEICAVKGLLK